MDQWCGRGSGVSKPCACRASPPPLDPPLVPCHLCAVQVVRVHYPGLVSHPDHAIAVAQMSGYGGVVSFEVDGDLWTTAKFIDSVQLPYIAPSLGGVESLIEQPTIIRWGRGVAQGRRQAAGGRLCWAGVPPLRASPARPPAHLHLPARPPPPPCPAAAQLLGPGAREAGAGGHQGQPGALLLRHRVAQRHLGRL